MEAQQLETPGLETRHIAFDVLCEVLLRKNPLDQVLTRHADFNTLEGRERNLARMLISTILRRKGQLDDLIRRALDKDQELHPQTLPVILYIGICQILFMDIPDHAAVDTSVRLAESEKLTKQKGLVNAILRRMTTEGKEWLKLQDEVTTNIPNWLLQHWIEDYDLKIAAEIAQGSLAEAPIDVTIKNPDEKNYWSAELRATNLATGSLRLPSGGGNVTEMLGFQEGAWWVQDASAAIPVTLLGDVKGKTVIDLCAAPGGKTSQLMATGANTIALDRSAKRLERLKENLARLKFEDNIEITVGDGAVWQPVEKVDAVLLDAPCSATGTLRRHPDVMHLKEEKDIQRLCDLQSRLLANAAQMIKPGGTLIYCTCSLQKAEGEHQIENFLQNHPDFSRQPVTADELGGLDMLINENGDVRVLPFHLAPSGGMDGFFISRLIKN